MLYEDVFTESLKFLNIWQTIPYYILGEILAADLGEALKHSLP